MKAFAITVGIMCIGASAHAQDWSTTFAPQNLGVVNAPVQSIVVIGAGGQPDAIAAANTFMAGLRASGRSSLVMDAAALGDVSALDDASIVARAQALPIGTVAVVRAFPNGAAPPSVVVALYDKSGASLGSWSCARGELLVAANAAPTYAPAYPGYAPAPYFAPPASGPAPELTARPGTVPVTFASVGRPLQLSSFAGTSYGVVSGYYNSYALNLVTFRSLCETPCTLYLPEGSAQLRVAGFGVRPATASFEVPPSGADLRLRSPSSGAFVGGFLLVSGGVGLLAAGIALIVVGNTTQPQLTLGGFSDTITESKNHGEIIAGGVLTGLSIAMLGGGIALLASNRGGVASLTPRQPNRPTAKLSVGIGNLTVRGTF